MHAALKVMPRYETQGATAEEENTREIDIATRASESMEDVRVQRLTNNSYFPVVFARGFCPTVVLDEPDDDPPVPPVESDFDSMCRITSASWRSRIAAPLATLPRPAVLITTGEPFSISVPT